MARTEGLITSYTRIKNLLPAGLLLNRRECLTKSFNLATQAANEAALLFEQLHKLQPFTKTQPQVRNPKNENGKTVLTYSRI